MFSGTVYLRSGTICSLNTDSLPILIKWNSRSLNASSFPVGGCGCPGWRPTASEMRGCLRGVWLARLSATQSSTAQCLSRTAPSSKQRVTPTGSAFFGALSATPGRLRFPGSAQSKLWAAERSQPCACLSCPPYPVCVRGSGGSRGCTTHTRAGQAQWRTCG